MILSYLYLFSLCLSREKGKSLSLFGLKDSNKLPLLAVFTFHKTEFHYDIEHASPQAAYNSVEVIIKGIVKSVEPKSDKFSAFKAAKQEVKKARIKKP